LEATSSSLLPFPTSGKARVGLCAEPNEPRAERAMIRERVMAGIVRARAEGKTMGRRRVEDSHPAKIKAVRAMRAKGAGVRKIAAEVGWGSVRC
jgi:hypothetical protein